MFDLRFAYVNYGLHFGDLREGCADCAISVCLRRFDGASVSGIDKFHVTAITMRQGSVCFNPWGAVATIIHIIVDSL